MQCLFRCNESMRFLAVSIYISRNCIIEVDIYCQCSGLCALPALTTVQCCPLLLHDLSTFTLHFRGWLLKVKAWVYGKGTEARVHVVPSPDMWLEHGLYLPLHAQTERSWRSSLLVLACSVFLVSSQSPGGLLPELLEGMCGEGQQKAPGRHSVCVHSFSQAH